MSRRSALSLVAFAVLLVAIVPFFGSEHLDWKEIAVPGSASHRILFELRLPRLLLTLVAGGALAMLGGSYQILFNNPLAEPYVLGVSSAVTLGVALSEILFHFPAYSYWGIAAGCVAALVVTAFLVMVATSRLGESVDRIVLFGMGLNFVLSSVLFLVLSYYYQHLGGGSIRWLFGQIPWVSLREAIAVALISVPFVVAMLVLSRHLDALSLGDSVARTLGFSPPRSRVTLMAITSIFLSLIVSFTGSIGFVGLVVPHAVRLVIRPPNSRVLLAFSFLTGAIFLGISDVISRALLPPFEFPIGIITTLIGGPAFLYLLWKR